MKKYLLAASLLAAFLPTFAQEERIDNGVVSIDDDRAMTIRSNNGNFEFKPYLMVQSNASFNWYDDEGLDKAYNQDNVANSGFAMPYAVLGFTGKAYDRVAYNLSINAAGSGAGLLQQAWFDVRLDKRLSLRAGKFKTPFTHAFNTTLGETLMPLLPTSLTAAVIMPHSLNAVTPSMMTGWDMGVQAHGLLGKDGKDAAKWGYEVGIYNGTAGNTNAATKTLSDDWHIPSLLYAARLTYMPWGVMPTTQGNAKRLNEKKMLIGASANLNVESENESTNDTRFGVEYALLYHRWYVGAEAYMMHVGFTKRMKIRDTFNYFGAYAQIGYFATPQRRRWLSQLAGRGHQLLFPRHGTETLCHVPIHRPLGTPDATRPRQRRPRHRHPLGPCAASILILTPSNCPPNEENQYLCSAVEPPRLCGVRLGQHLSQGNLV